VGGGLTIGAVIRVVGFVVSGLGPLPLRWPEGVTDAWRVGGAVVVGVGVSIVVAGFLVGGPEAGAPTRGFPRRVNE
jgi:hypothetical protein